MACGDVSFSTCYHRIKELQRDINAKELLIAAQQNEIAELQKQVPKRRKATSIELNEDLPINC